MGRAERLPVHNLITHFTAPLETSKDQRRKSFLCSGEWNLDLDRRVLYASLLCRQEPALVLAEFLSQGGAGDRFRAPLSLINRQCCRSIASLPVFETMRQLDSWISSNS
jgi:hypothetical protein